MTRKNEQLYIVVLSSISELIPCFIPEFAVGDFEIAPKNALKGIYPTVTIIADFTTPKRITYAEWK